MDSATEILKALNIDLLFDHEAFRTKIYCHNGYEHIVWFAVGCNCEISIFDAQTILQIANAPACEQSVTWWELALLLRDSNEELYAKLIAQGKI